MPSARSQNASAFRVFAGVLGVGLLAYLVFRVGPGMLLKQTLKVGWGMVLIFLLGGCAHLIKTWAWQLTFRSEFRAAIPLRRAFRLRLISEAIGQFGVAGQVVGEGMRVSMLGPSVPVAVGISSATIDRGLYTISAAIVGIAGLIGAALWFPLSHMWKVLTFGFAGGMFAFVLMLIVAVRRQWPMLSAVARGLHALPGLRNRLQSAEQTMQSAEQELFGFYRQSPWAFWASFSLNVISQLLAVLEVYLILLFMGSRIGFLSAFVFEGFTKLVNTVGGLIPGNIGTYEGGSMLIAKLFHISAAAGLSLGICRRARALFWAGIGALCLIAMSHKNQPNSDVGLSVSASDLMKEEQLPLQESYERSSSNSTTVIIVGGFQTDLCGFTPALARIATLPAALRVVLSAQSLKVNRTIVCVESLSASRTEREFRRSGRSPKSLEWYTYFHEFDLGSLVREVGVSGKVLLVLGDRSYQPSLLRKAVEWKKPDGVLAFTSDSGLVGIYVLSLHAALNLAHDCNSKICTMEDLHHWAESCSQMEIESVDSLSWQRISSPADLPQAEAKLNKWLVKPTDGLFAQMNRRVSIPISRFLLRWPITPNMVTLFTLGVSFGAGAFFAHGGYWATLLGAALSVWASILDGSDGEVARLKLQSTDFGCWLETVCDYLYYVFVFGGMIVGFTRTMGAKFTLTWGPMLLLGAIASFLAVGFARQHFSKDRPEAFLSVWQGKAEKRKSNPLLYVGRHCEFIIRRCFLPYAFLGFALLNILPYAFVATAIGANIVWCIALYSCFTLSRGKGLKSSALASEPPRSPATA